MSQLTFSDLEYSMRKTGKTPGVWSFEPQWDGKEIPKLIIEVAVSAVLAWVFLRLGN